MWKLRTATGGIAQNETKKNLPNATLRRNIRQVFYDEN